MKAFLLAAAAWAAVVTAAAPADAQPSPFYGTWDCSEEPAAGAGRTCLPDCGPRGSRPWKVMPDRRTCPLSGADADADAAADCESNLADAPPLCCPPWALECSADRALSAAPCDGGEIEIDGKCLPQIGGARELPATAEVCAMFGGEALDAGGGRVCVRADAVGTFCLLSSREALPCRGLFKQARQCNFSFKRPALNPFLCGPACPAGRRPLGGRCVPEQRADLTALERHCPRRRGDDAEQFPRQPEENRIYRRAEAERKSGRLTDDSSPPAVAGKICALSAQPYRHCYAAAAALAGLPRDAFIDDNGEALTAIQPPLFPCDEALDLCPRGQAAPDDNPFAEGDCADAPPTPHKIDLVYLEAKCPRRTGLYPLQPEENNIYRRNDDPASSRQAAGKICDLTPPEPAREFRYCYALHRDAAAEGLRKRDLVDDNDQVLSDYAFPLNLCDEALRFCPPGQVDGDGNFFTENDCVAAEE